MCWLQRLREGAEWAEQMWEDLPATTRARVIDEISNTFAQLLDPGFYMDLAREEITARFAELQRRADEYRRDPQRLRTEFIDYMLPGTRYGELARLLRPGSEPVDGLDEAIRRPVILVPGMVGTRLIRSEAAAPARAASPSDPVSQWFEQEFRSDSSTLLRDLPPALRNLLRPALTRISERHLYNPNMIWDPDSPYALVHLMNKTATERGQLFCAADTPGAPPTEFAPLVAEAMTLRGLLGLWYGPAAERVAREMALAFAVSDPAHVLEDARYEELRRRRRDRGWCQPVWDVSRHWLLPLERAFGEVIYAFGYDWRAPLGDSVALLVRKIERVKRAHDGKSPILVTHSFGGLLARAAALRRPTNVAGIVQVFSPTAGSVKMYSNFKKGGGCAVPPGWQGEQPPEQTALQDFCNIDTLTSLLSFDPLEMGFAMYLGWDTHAFAATSAGVYGAYSLLPNNVRRFGSAGHWLTIEDDPALAARLQATANVYDLYRQFDRPWGLLDGSVWTEGATVMTGDTSERAWAWLNEQDGPAGSFARLLHSLQIAGVLRMFTRETLDSSQVQRVRERVNFGIDAAERLNAAAGDYIHPNTWSLYSTGLDTTVGFNIRRTTSATEPYATRRSVSQAGDASLEVASARALSSSLHNELHLTGANHAHAMGDSPDARSALIKSVYLAMVAAHRAG